MTGLSAVLVSLAPGPAAGGGIAFPNSAGIFAPAGQPGEILVSTSLGLITSEDGGQTWTWSCGEEALGSFAYLQPAHRLFAFGTTLFYSDDGSCSWHKAGGLVSGGAYVYGVSVNPGNPDRVLANVAFQDGDGGLTVSLLESSDGGATYGAIRYMTGALIASARSAPTDPSTIYLTSGTDVTAAPVLTYTNDDGASWHTADLSSAIGPGSVFILGVDATRPDRLFLRQVSMSNAALVVVTGAGANAARTLTIAGSLLAFLQTTDGTMFVSGLSGLGGPLLYRSTDDAASFVPVANPPHIRALAERGGVLYAATDSTTDLFIEAMSADKGATWQPGPTFGDVQGITSCVKAACQASCQQWVQQQIWPAAVCSADVAPIDAGADAHDAAAESDATAGGGTGGAGASAGGGGAAAGAGGGTLPSRSGCGCGVEPGPRSSGALSDAALLLSLVAILSARRAKARPRPWPAPRRPRWWWPAGSRSARPR
jgi:hypothetical protein